MLEPALVDALRAMAAGPGRRLLGLAGPPGVGKSTFAEAAAAALGADAVALVPMDGFHLANAELARLGRAHRKGAPDTFDVAGYAALLARLRAGEGGTVYAPVFRREIEEAVAGAIPVPPGPRLVVTEGNYLLHDAGGWEHVRALLDAVWYLDLDEATRLARLTARHVAFGRDHTSALAWVEATDQPNARLIARGRARADRIVTLPGDGTARP